LRHRTNDIRLLDDAYSVYRPGSVNLHDFRMYILSIKYRFIDLISRFYPPVRLGLEAVFRKAVWKL
jgi:hypothetical protein